MGRSYRRLVERAGGQTDRSARELNTLLSDPDPDKARKAMQAMLQM